MQQYLLDNDPTGAATAAALTSSSGFSVGFTANADQRLSLSLQVLNGVGTSPLSVAVYDPSGSQVSTSQPWGISNGSTIDYGVQFTADEAGLFTAVVKDAYGYTKAQNVAVSVTEAGLPPVYLSDLHAQASTTSRFTWDDTTTHQSGADQGQNYPSPVNYLQWQYIWSPSDDVSVTSKVPDVFLKGSVGDDALAANGGSNVLDGNTGSNFLVGATGVDGGQDTFFVDGRGSAATWSTAVNFHAGDSVTIWGYVPGQSVLSWAADDGSPGYQGATIHAATGGAGTTVNASFTFAGMSLAQAQQDLAVASGTVGGSSYLYVHDIH
jgi:hypothetical protein